MSNAAIVRSGNLVKIVPIPEAGAAGAISVGAGEPGFGVSLVPLRYTSASTVAKTAESFLSRPGAIRVVQSRNLLLIQGTTAERQAALDVVSTFDVEWLQNQSVGVYPLKSTSPETMITELERIFETNDGGLGQGVIRFQPVSRMNAVMVVTKNPKLLAQTTQWVNRLDRSDTTGTTLRTFRLKNGNATQVAKILNDLFVGQRSGGTADAATKQIAPGVESAQSRLDSVDRGSSGGARRHRQAAVPTIAAPIRSQPRSSRSRTARTARRTHPAVRLQPPAGMSRVERFRTCGSRRTPPIIRSWSTPTRRTIGWSSARYAISIGLNCRYRSTRRSPKSR
jgi:general secretion pathway protein D